MAHACELAESAWVGGTLVDGKVGTVVGGTAVGVKVGASVGGTLVAVVTGVDTLVAVTSGGAADTVLQAESNKTQLAKSINRNFIFTLQNKLSFSTQRKP